MFGAYGIKNIVAHQHWAGFKIEKRKKMGSMSNIFDILPIYITSYFLGLI